MYVLLLVYTCMYFCKLASRLVFNHFKCLKRSSEKEHYNYALNKVNMLIPIIYLCRYTRLVSL